MWMILLGVLTFFAKVIVVCAVQTFVRWTLPRFRYDQLMKLGWKILLPASLANILVTGVVYLSLDAAGPGVAEGLKTAGDIAGAIVWATIGFTGLRAVAWLVKPIRHKQTLLGSSADQARRLGGTKSTPMQA
jgi:NADH-quinone oxidoreductase subunit H